MHLCMEVSIETSMTYDGGDCCLVVRISLANEFLNAELEFLNGDYEISLMPNGRTSWINGDYAIWYYPIIWIIGDLADRGELIGHIVADNNFYGVTDDKNEWKYWDGNSWTFPIDPTDVQITCVKNNKL